MIKRMAYRRYKQFYMDCKTVKYSYDERSKTVEVEVPSGRAEIFDFPELACGDRIEEMPYRQYKNHYADCKTVKDSFDFDRGTIRVIIPDGRMKESGVRGRHFHGFEFWLIDEKGKAGYCAYRAVDYDHAWKQHIKWCKENGWTPLENAPEGKIAHIYL